MGADRSRWLRPHTVTKHCVGASRPRIIRMVVVFPAPFGSRKPATMPGRMEKDRSLTAMVEP
jgi:hypothetical protein